MSPAPPVAPQAAAVTAKTRPARTWMIVAVFILFVSEWYPYETSQSTMYVDGSYNEHYSDAPDRYRQTTDHETDGWQFNRWSVALVPLLFALFCTSLYKRPGFTRWLYWAGLLGVVLCIGIPPPLSTIGGLIGTLAFVVACYAAYLHSQNKIIAPAT